MVGIASRERNSPEGLNMVTQPGPLSSRRRLATLFHRRGFRLHVAPASRTPMTPRLTQSRLLIVSAVLAVTAGLVWFGGAYSIRNTAFGEAAVLLNALSRQGDSDLDAPALRQIEGADYATRQAALELLLSSDDHLPRFSAHRQGLMVALSQVRIADAVELARAVLIPALEEATYPPTLDAASDLFHRWSIAGQLAPAEAVSLAGSLLNRLAASTDTLQQAPWSLVVADLGPVLDDAERIEFLNSLVPLIETEPDPAALALLMEAALGLAQDLDPDALAPFAESVERRFSTADQTMLRVLVEKSRAIPTEAFQAAPDIGNLTAELATGIDVGSLILRLTELDLAVPRLDDNQTSSLAATLVERASP